MKAIVVDRWMEPEDLKVQEYAEPEITRGMLGIDVKAAGCNFFDILLVQGKYQAKPPFPFVPGGEVAGVVREVGPETEGFRVGDRVMGAIPTGGYAERAAIPAIAAYRFPDKMSFEEAAGFPIVYPTSYAGLVYRANLQAGETLLVHAAAGGVGIAAVQIGKALGARVIGTAGSDDKLERVKAEGADFTINYKTDDWVQKVRDLTDGKGADVIYDPVGGDILDRSLKCIAWNGRLLVIGFASGTIPEIKANRILLKNIAVVGLHWGAYAVNEPQRMPETFDALFKLYDAGKIRPVVYKRYPLEKLPEALRALGSRETYGKAVVAP
jgi:NADPH2:quinone reductase